MVGGWGCGEEGGRLVGYTREASGGGHVVSWVGVLMLFGIGMLGGGHVMSWGDEMGFIESGCGMLKIGLGIIGVEETA